MPLDAMSFGIDAIAARQQGATDFNPALLGTLLSKSRMMGLLFTILLARREAAAASAGATPAPSAGSGIAAVKTVPVPDVTTHTTSQESDHAWHKLASLGFAVKAVSKSGSVLAADLTKAVKVLDQDIKPPKQARVGATITLTLDSK